MHIVIVHNSKIPVLAYGGIERIVWYLAEELFRLGHKITFLVKEGSWSSFADVIYFDFEKSINKQIPESADFVHVHFQPKEIIEFPHLITIHGNLPKETRFDANTNFVSQNHAKRYNANAFVYNGLNWNDYGIPDFEVHRKYVHFLGKAAWRVKNVKGAIQLADRNKTEIKVMGGKRLNFKMGFRFTFSRFTAFYGMVGQEQKNEILKHSKGLIFPVLWHEPFGLAIIESLYFGCPVIGTNYGALPEIISSEFGFLSNSLTELCTAFKRLELFDRKKCHEYAVENFNSGIMAENYLKLYKQILNGEKINAETPCYNEIENKLDPLKA